MKLWQFITHWDCKSITECHAAPCTTIYIRTSTTQPHRAGPGLLSALIVSTNNTYASLHLQGTVCSLSVEQQLNVITLWHLAALSVSQQCWGRTNLASRLLYTGEVWGMSVISAMIIHVVIRGERSSLSRGSLLGRTLRPQCVYMCIVMGGLTVMNTVQVGEWDGETKQVWHVSSLKSSFRYS